MKRTITYKDFTLTYVYNRNNKRYEGSVNDFDDGISFVGRTKEEIKESFKDAVDGYYKMMDIVDREMSGKDSIDDASDFCIDRSTSEV